MFRTFCDLDLLSQRWIQYALKGGSFSKHRDTSFSQRR
jgi:hypothetical protein